MLVALMAYDKDGAFELRKANRDAHVTYLKSSDVDNYDEMLIKLILMALS